MPPHATVWRWRVTSGTRHVLWRPKIRQLEREKLRPRISVALSRRLVHSEKLQRRCIVNPHRAWVRLKKEPILFFLFLDVLGRDLLLSHIPCRKIDEPFLGRTARLPLEPAIRSILTAVPIFEISPIVAASQSSCCLFRGGPIIRMNKMNEWFSLELGAVVAEDLFGCPIDTLEITIETGGADHLPR